MFSWQRAMGKYALRRYGPEDQQAKLHVPETCAFCLHVYAHPPHMQNAIEQVVVRRETRLRERAPRRLRQ